MIGLTIHTIIEKISLGIKQKRCSKTDVICCVGVALMHFLVVSSPNFSTRKIIAFIALKTCIP